MVIHVDIKIALKFYRKLELLLIFDNTNLKTGKKIRPPAFTSKMLKTNGLSTVTYEIVDGLFY